MIHLFVSCIKGEWLPLGSASAKLMKVSKKIQLKLEGDFSSRTVQFGSTETKED